MRISHIIGSVLGLSILISIFYFNRFDVQVAPPVNKNIGEGVIGHSIVSSNWWISKRIGQIQTDTSEKIYVVVSPSCPHCRHILSILNSNQQYVTINTPILPVFKEKTNFSEINRLIREENISYPIFKIREKSVLDSLKLVPAFVYVNKSIIRNIIIGGVANQEELDILVNSIKKVKWKSNVKSQQVSACSH